MMKLSHIGMIAALICVLAGLAYYASSSAPKEPVLPEESSSSVSSSQTAENGSQSPVSPDGTVSPDSSSAESEAPAAPVAGTYKLIDSPSFHLKATVEFAGDNTFHADARMLVFKGKFDGTYVQDGHTITCTVTEADLPNDLDPAAFGELTVEQQPDGTLHLLVNEAMKSTGINDEFYAFEPYTEK